MKLGPLEIRRAQAAAATTPTAATPTAELGASGTVNFQGFLQALEYLPELAGRVGVDVYEQMRSSDGSVQEALGHITAPILNADWDVEAAGEEPEDIEIAQAVRCAFFDWMEQPFSEYLDHVLDYLVFGHQLFELTWQVVDAELEYEDPDTREQVTIPSRQFVTFRRFSPRLPKTIYKWNADNGDLVSVQQQVFRDGRLITPEIPVERLLLYVHSKRGDDFFGRSLLRSAVKPWKLKDLIEKIEVVALEKHGVGTWVGYLPASSRDDAAMVARVEKILQDVRAGTYGYIVAPFPKQTTDTGTGDGGLFEVITPSVSLPEFKMAKEYHRGEIKGSVLVRFSELGHSSVGARATGDTQSKIWYDALHSVARYVCEVNEKAIRMFVDANYAGVYEYPKLVSRNIESRTLAEYAAAVSALVAAGAIEPDLSFRQSVRTSIGAPEEDPETDQALKDAADQAQLNPDVGQPKAPGEAEPAPSRNGNGDQAAATARLRRDYERDYARLEMALGAITRSAPPPAVVNIPPTHVTVEPSPVTIEKGAVQVDVQAPPAANVTIERGAVQVDAPPASPAPAAPPAPNVEVKIEKGAVQVDVGAPPAPSVTIEKGAVDVHVDAPEAPPAPNVEVHVEGKQQRKTTRRIHRDQQGLIERIEEEDDGA